jgi:alpha-beta hydrolase superfamily lysophospholipase
MNHSIQTAAESQAIAAVNYASAWVDFANGEKRFTHFWGVPRKAQATLYLIHGLGEHGGRYHQFAQEMVQRGYFVIAIDQQGHGRTVGPRGCIKSYESLLDDIEALLKWDRHELPQGPKLLFGHSMGGNLVLNYSLRREFLPQATIASSPMIRASRPPGRLFELVARGALIVAPNFRIQSKPRAERLMDDPVEQLRFEQDDLFHSQLSLRLGGALLDTGRWLLDNAHQLRIPTLVSHGLEDDLTCPQASQEFAQKSGEICDLLLLPDHLHDPFRDRERKSVIDHFDQFYRRQLEGSLA